MTYYAMFTDAGNQAIDGLVTSARALELEWPAVDFALQVLSRKPLSASPTKGRSMGSAHRSGPAPPSWSGYDRVWWQPPWY